MPRHAKGARLYLRRGKLHKGRRLPDVYVIRDGAVELGTGCGPDRLHGAQGAEEQLAAYIAAKGAQAPHAGSGSDRDPDRPSDPAEVLVAEVLAYYAAHRAPDLANPSTVASSVSMLLAWWGDKTLADVKRSTCKAYVDHRSAQPWRQARHGAALDRRVTPMGARRELENLSAAIGFWAGEYPLTARPIVWLPDRPESNRDALTRDQAAALLKAARGYRWDPAAPNPKARDGRGAWLPLSGSGRANRAHLKRFILIGLYTGTRPGVIPRILWREGLLHPWADLDEGRIYRRGRGEREHRTKRRPMVRMPDRLLAHMKRWKKADENIPHRKVQAGREKAAPVTVIHHGGLPIAGRLRKAFANCVRDAGLPAGITPHWMRHTCATWLMENDVDAWDAAAYTGMTVKTLEANYAHHRPGHHDKARRAVGGKGT